MKGTITKNANTETETVMKDFVDKMYTKRGIIFQEILALSCTQVF